MEQRYRRIEGQKLGPVCVAHNHDFAKGVDLQPKAQGRQEGGRGDNDPGPMDFRGPIMGPLASRGP